MRLMLNVADYRQAARRRLPRGIFEYVDRGTEDELSLDDNRRALDALKLVPTVLRDVTDCALDVELFGHRQALPLVIAPTAVAGLVACDGETRVARAAAAAGIPFCVSTQSITAIEQIASGSGAHLWFQLYVFRDRSIGEALVERAKQAGAQALVLTVDTVVSPNREYNVRNGFGVPFRPNLRALADAAMHPRWAVDVWLRMLLKGGVPAYAHYPPELRTPLTGTVPERVRLDPSLDWEYVKRLRRLWPGPLILKGILHPDDAQRAVDCGADGIVVSNHGGRNLDGALPPVLALPRIVDRVGQRLTVLADSGVQRGTDVMKLLALGARAVMLGRSVLYGAAVDGAQGAGAVIDILSTELGRAMRLAGCTSVVGLKPDVLAAAG
jgi:(S)-mandelate dehydrogenase